MVTESTSRGAHRYHLRYTAILSNEPSPEELESLPEGWRVLRREEVMDEDEPGDPESEVEPLKAGEAWVHWVLEVDAQMEGPADRSEADRVFRDRAEAVTGSRPGPGSSWSLRSAPRELVV